MNIGLKFRDALFGALGQTVREELDQLVASIVQHWLVGHNVDGSHSNAIGRGAGTPTGSKYLRDDMTWVEGDFAEVNIGETISGAWTFSTLPVLSTLTGYLKGTAGALSAVSAVPIADVTITGTPDGTKFLRDDGTWAAPPGAAGGETNTASNYGVGGVGFYDSKSGVDLRFRNLIAKSAKLAVTLDAAEREVEVDLGSVALNDLSNVTLSSEADGFFLRHDGVDWKDSTIQESDIPSHAHAGTDITSGEIAAGRLGSGTPDATKFLRGDQTWAVPPGSGGIDDLTDVTITAAAAGDFLRHSGTAWVDATITDGDLGSGTPDNTKFLRGDRAWAAPTVTIAHDWMYPLGRGTMASNVTCADGTCYAACVGRLTASATSVKVNFYVQTAMAGVVTYAEVAIGKSSQPTTGIPAITPVGYADVSAVINGVGGKSVTVNVSGGQTLAAGDYLWIMIAQNAASTNPAVSGITSADHQQVGVSGTKATFQPSTGIGSAQTFTITGYTVASIAPAALPS